MNVLAFQLDQVQLADLPIQVRSTPAYIKIHLYMRFFQWLLIFLCILVLGYGVLGISGLGLIMLVFQESALLIHVVVLCYLFRYGRTNHLVFVERFHATMIVPGTYMSNIVFVPTG